ncbi:UDP-glycosyltransferase UGT5 [Leptinotarsa decemlineata]|uniref:UDP-glycosyltransferase UGT5 n=1 Tax=Leptinotarsa decemlineata TaxID=7539 RepID=UPI003D30CEBE
MDTCKFVFLVFFASVTVERSDELNILVVFPHSGKSHQLVFDPLFKELTVRGHNLTVITEFPQKEPVKNWRDISISDGNHHTTEMLDSSMLTGTRLDRYMGANLIASFANHTCTQGLQHKNFQNFLKEKNHFDLLIIELFNTNCFMGLAKKYGIPAVGLSTTIAPQWVQSLFGLADHPAYVSNHFMGYSDRLTFWERVENTIMLLENNLIYTFLSAKPGNELSKRHLGIDLLEGGDIMYNVSIMLTNTHFSLNLPKPLVPAVIEVGGIHVQDPKPLPDDLMKFMNESPDGVIYMSLGSTLKSHSLPKEKRDAFLKAFSRIKQRVILKWEVDIPEKPNNVKILRWAPQRDILAHPNLKGFISHGGLLGTLEAVHSGVPIMAVPQFGDQFTNVKALEAVGGGFMFDFHRAMEDNVLEALKRLLSTELKNSASALSERFKDRPLSPMDTAVYWIEYVAKYKGAPHIRTAAVDMPFYKYLLLDVIAFLLAVVFALLYVVYFMARFVLKRIFRKETKVKKS